MNRRVVEYSVEGKAVAVYDSIDKAAEATGIDRNNIAKNLLGMGSQYVNHRKFKWEVTNKELREARLKDRKHRHAQKLEELEKEFHIR